jgi:hypothetical protein
MTRVDERRGKAGACGYGQRVLCCRECNALLGNRALLTVEERAGYIADALASRYKRLLSAPTWTDAELEDMGTNLRRKIKSDARKSAVIRARVERANMVAGA